MATGTVLALAFIIGQILSLINSFATKQQVETVTALVVDRTTELDAKIDQINQTLNVLNKDNQELNKTVSEWLEIETGRLAAELENDRRLKATAAAAGRKEYREALKNGKAPMEALRIGARTYLNP
jgi:peptidoglycan hydrolase CwlO-like protein